MRIFACLLVLFCVLHAGPSVAQEGNQDAAYLAMVDKAMADPASVNWTEFRELYTHTSFYKPYAGLTFWPAFERSAEAAAGLQMPGADKEFAQLQRQHWANYTAHAYAISVATKTDTPIIDKAKSQAALEAIADSVVASGDGGSMKHAYRIVTLEEEKIIVEGLLGSRTTGVQSKKQEGRTYDLVSAVQDKTKKLSKVFFDTTLITSHQ